MLLAIMPPLPPILTLSGASKFTLKSGDHDRQPTVAASTEGEGYGAVAEVLMVVKALKDVGDTPRTVDAAGSFLVDGVETWLQEAAVNLSLPNFPCQALWNLEIRIY